jgi:predicted DNA-binding transcriptional regulator YafY
VSQAVWESRRIRLRYESWAGETTRTLEPLGLVLKGGEWYFMAVRRGRPAIHKLENARDLELLPETFDRPRRFELAAAWSQAVEAFTAGLRRTEARIRVHDRALSRLDRLGADVSEAILAAPADAEGWREATVWIESVPYAAGLILGFGPDIVVRSPEDLRAELRRRALQVADLYAERDGGGDRESPPAGRP